MSSRQSNATVPKHQVQLGLSPSLEGPKAHLGLSWGRKELLPPRKPPPSMFPFQLEKLNAHQRKHSEQLHRSQEGEAGLSQLYIKIPVTFYPPFLFRCQGDCGTPLSERLFQLLLFNPFWGTNLETYRNLQGGQMMDVAAPASPDASSLAYFPAYLSSLLLSCERLTLQKKNSNLRGK